MGVIPVGVLCRFNYFLCCAVGCISSEVISHNKENYIEEIFNFSVFPLSTVLLYDLFHRLLYDSGYLCSHLMALSRGMTPGLAGGVVLSLPGVFLLSTLGDACTVILCSKPERYKERTWAKSFDITYP